MVWGWEAARWGRQRRWQRWLQDTPVGMDIGRSQRSRRTVFLDLNRTVSLLPTVITGTHPLLPLDISAATYLLPPPESVISTTELIACHAIALQKRWERLSQLHSDVYEAQLRAALCLNMSMPPQFATMISNEGILCSCETRR
jgi:hypothetical protein